jgi:gamma-glutamylcyclotransferase (GGCT)/AIG2-like uncharacterized protein YtfP
MPSSDAQPPALFVYGTLKRGQINDVLLQPHVQSVEPAWTLGTLYDLGDFPALDPGSSVVHGELVRVTAEALPDLLAILDGLEGYLDDDRGASHYLRELIDVSTNSGEYYRANAYFYNRANPLLPSLDQFPIVTDGVWSGPDPRRESAARGLEHFRRHVAAYRHNTGR